MERDAGRVIVFSSKRCPPCLEAEKILKKEGIDFKKIDVDTKDGAKLANKKGIKALPTIIVNGKRIEGLSEDLEKVIKYG